MAPNSVLWCGHERDFGEGHRQPHRLRQANPQKHGGTKEAQSPRVLTHNGKAAAVVLSISAFDKLMQDAEEHRLDVRLKAAVDAYAAGERGDPLDEAFAQIRQHTIKGRTGK